MNRNVVGEKIKRMWNYILACLIAVIVMIPFYGCCQPLLKAKGH